MQAARIRPLTEPLEGAVARHMAKLLPPGMPAPNLFLSVARNTGLFGFLVDSGLIGPTGLLDRRVLPKNLRETIILRTCVATGNDYEFTLHVQTISARMGLSQAQINDVRAAQPSDALWSPALLAAMALVDALVRRQVSDNEFALARAHFDEETLIEITQLAGLYVGVAMLVTLIRPQVDTYDQLSKSSV
ncbi:MAG TPA: carboxymuconolactone decarboxylase family protein [Polaromonas sp.]|uniref:carboxymuconolactone decarboxylase family protein n=1 Tax=Polaromonas sp. TaxID=1869339 RepID=UPI002D47C9A2|nr:carboxymuconolactone decarboxylase family protein [Polaromonas sp.]HYW56551.1 carboxymuconolactone decarboxylase family protein [Polaromonas sp.]